MDVLNFLILMLYYNMVVYWGELWGFVGSIVTGSFVYRNFRCGAFEGFDMFVVVLVGVGVVYYFICERGVFRVDVRFSF